MKIPCQYLLFMMLMLARCAPEPAESKTVRSDNVRLDTLLQSYGLVDIRSVDSSIRVDLRYADTNNFLGINMYKGLRHAYLTRAAALRLSRAQDHIRRQHPSLSLIVFDAARPKYIQQLMWDSLKMTPYRKYNYLSPPSMTSMHNYGCAVDVGLIDRYTNTLLDMGAGYDHFEKIAQPVYEWYFLRNGKLAKTAYRHRLILRNAMRCAGFRPINSEWWHFSMGSKAEAIAKFKLIE